jgi:hypothetical protein
VTGFVVMLGKMFAAIRRWLLKKEKKTPPG